MTTSTGPTSTHVNLSIVSDGYFRLHLQALAIPVPHAHQPLRLLVTGSRDFSDAAAVAAVLLGIAFTHGPLAVRDGHCPKGGLDQLAHDFAVAHGWPTFRTPAEWNRYGRAAGPIRNQVMVDTNPDLCVGWPDNLASSKGTKDCLTRAVKAHIPTYVVTQERGAWAVHPMR